MTSIEAPSEQPPLAEPLPPAEPPRPAGVFYRIDSRHITLREFLFDSNPVNACLAWIVKHFGVRFPCSTDDLPVQDLEPFETDLAQFGPDAQAQFDRPHEQLAALGFSHPVYHRIADPHHSSTTCLATYRHELGRAIARIHQRVWTYPHPPRIYLFVEFITPLADGSFIWSTSARPDMIWPRCCKLIRKIDAEPATLWEAHQAAVAAPRGPGAAILPIRSDADLRTAAQRHHAALRDFHLQRGVFVHFTADEQRESESIQQIKAAATNDGQAYPEVTVALNQLQKTPKRSWRNALLLLAISMALFIGAGVTQTGDWEFIALLVPVLLFHEMGHYVAMRLLHYRNLRMFFIPFLGAAVSGRNYNAPGWKKVIVSLAGPIPGILLGAVLVPIAIKTGTDLYMKLAVVLLLLNGFNLLPVLPLDGGWVMHALLFSRSHLADVIFRILAVAALAGIGLWLGDWVFPMLAVVMAVGIPAAYRLSRIVHDLRRSGFTTIATDGQTIPPDAAQVIVDKITTTFGRSIGAQTIAQHTLSIFEMLNARPPGVFASLGLGTLYLGSIAAPLLCAAMFFGANRHHSTPENGHPPTPAPLTATQPAHQ